MKIFYLTFLLSLFTFVFTGAIPEDEFVPLPSFKTQKIELNNESKEAYYLFTNNFDNSDIVLNMKIAKGFTVHMYVYDSIDKIEKDSEGRYINHLHDILLNQKEAHFKAESKGKLYLLIKDIENYFDVEYLTMFNENDTMTLTDESSFVIKRFYSSKTFTINVKVTQTEKAKMSIENYVKDQLDQIVVKSDDQVLVDTKDDVVDLEFDTAKNVMITITTTKDAYIDDAKLITISSNRKVKEIILNHGINVNFVKSGKIYLYSNIDNYEDDEVNTAILKHEMPKEISQYEIVSVLGKQIESDKSDDETLMPLMPKDESENEIKFAQKVDSDEFDLIYFKRSKTESSDKHKYLLIVIDINVKDSDAHSFFIIVSSPINRIGLIESKNTLTYETKADVPMYIEMKVKTDQSLSYIVYLQNGDYMTIYNGTLYKFDDINDQYQKERLFAIANGKESYLNTYTIMLFSDIPQTMKLIIEVTKSDLVYYKEERPVVMIQKEMINCDKPYYIFGSFSYYGKSNYAYLDALSGEFELYKKTLDETSESVFPTEDNKIDHVTLLDDTFLDVLAVKCKSPGVMNLHIMSNVADKVNLSKYDRYIGYFANSTTKNILLPAMKTMNIEFISYLKNSISIQINDTKIELSNENPISHLTFNAKTYKTDMLITIGDSDAVLGISISSDNLYKEVKETSYRVEGEHVLIPIAKKDTYKYVDINIYDHLGNKTFYIAHGRESSKFFSLPSLSQRESIEDGDINVRIHNPYEMLLNPMYTVDDLYYLVVDLELGMNETSAVSDVSISYIDKDPIEPTPSSTNTILSDENKKIKITTESDLSKNLNILAKSCAPESNLNLYFYDDLVSQYDVSQKYKLITMKNSMTQYIIEFEDDGHERYRGMIVNYLYGDVDEEKINKYNEMNWTITAESGKEISFSSVDEVDHYEIFILDKSTSNDTNTTIELLNNECYLNLIKSSNEDKVTFIEANTTKVSVNITGEVFINVIAVIKGNQLLRINYGARSLTITNGSLLWFWITMPCVIVFILLAALLILRNKKKNIAAESGRLIPDSVGPNDVA